MLDDKKNTVVAFKPPEQREWGCECGCNQFYILDGYIAECCNCENEINLNDMY